MTLWLSAFLSAFTYIVGPAIGIGFVCDKYVRQAFKNDVWHYMISQPTILSQSRLRDFAKAYIDHTAFHLFSAHPLSWKSFRTSTIITFILLALLASIYYSINNIDVRWASFTVIPVIAILILGIIITDYLSTVLTLYVMRYAKTASHFLELVFLFIADLILTANLFSFVFAIFLALAAFSLLHTHGVVDIYITTMASANHSGGCGIMSERFDESNLETLETAAQRLGVVHGCATVFLGRPGSVDFVRTQIAFLSSNISTEHVTSAFFGKCSLLKKRPVFQKSKEFPQLEAFGGVISAWELKDREKDDIGNDEAQELAGYECDAARIRYIAALDANPLSLYSEAYDLATIGQRAFLALLSFRKVEIDIAKASEDSIWGFIRTRSPDFGFLYDHGKISNVRHIGWLDALCTDCVVIPFLDVNIFVQVFHGGTVLVPLPVFFLSSFFITFFFYLLTFVFIFSCALLGQVPRTLLLIDRFTILADYPFTLVFAFAGILSGTVVGAIMADGVL